MKNITSGEVFNHSSYIPCTHNRLAGKMLLTLQSIGAKRILDIGCGNGIMAKFLIDHGFEVVGLDPGSESVSNFRRLLPEVRIYQMDIYDDPSTMAEADFDAVISTEVIEHLFFPGKLLEFASAKLKPNGYLLVSTPYHGYVKNLFLSIFNKWDYHHSSLWDGGHIKFWSKSTLGRLFRENGFEVTTFIGCGRVSLLWNNMIMVGRYSNQKKI